MSDSKIHSPYSRRILGLDIVRAVAIILVVLGHGRFILNDTPLEGFPNFPMIDGVDVFFVLSGFLIGGILLKEINRKKPFRGKELLTFWKRRWFRTLPNYYLILAANYVVVKYGVINEDIDQFGWDFLIFTQNFKEPFYGFFWESWSLSIEEWFYLISPVLIVFFLRIFNPKSSYLLAASLMIVIPLVYRISIIDEEMGSFWWDVTFRKTVLCRLDSIGYGLLLAWGFFYHKQFWRKRKWYLFFLGMALIVFQVNFHQPPGSFYKQTFYFSVTPMAVMFTLPVFALYRGKSGVWQGIVTHISKISYSMYLINLALVASVIRDNFPPQGGWDGIMKYGIYWVVVIGVSSLIYRYFEKPMMDLRDR